MFRAMVAGELVPATMMLSDVGELRVFSSRTRQAHTHTHTADTPDAAETINVVIYRHTVVVVVPPGLRRR